MRKRGKKKSIRIRGRRFAISFVLAVVCVYSMLNLTKKYIERKAVSSNIQNNSIPATKKVASKNKKVQQSVAKKDTPANNNKKSEQSVTKKDSVPNNNNVKSEQTNNKNNSKPIDKAPSKPSNTEDPLKQSIFFGDSITEGLSFYEVLDESQVLAIKGLDLFKANRQVDKLADLKPKKVFVLLGSNDVESGMTSNQYMDRYKKLVENIESKVPNCKIYLESVLPVTEKVKQRQPNFSDARIDEFNNVLKDIAKEDNVEYVNLIPIIKDNQQLYEQDGIHFKPEFCKLWVKYVKDNVH